MLQLTFVFLSIALALTCADEFDLPDNETVPRMEYSSTFTTVGPVSEKKKLILDLNTKIQEETKDAFNDAGSPKYANKYSNYQNTFSNAMGTINIKQVEGLETLQLVDLETDIYQLQTQFNVMIPNVTVQGSFKVNENTQIEDNNAPFQEVSFSAQLSIVNIKGSASLYLRKSSRQLNYRRFTIRQRIQDIKIVLDNNSSEVSSIAKLEKEIGKTLLTSAFEKTLSAYLENTQKAANARIRQINLEDFLPEKVLEFFVVLDFTAGTNTVVDGHEFLSDLYTKTFKSFLDKQLVSLPTVSFPVRRKMEGLENTWVYGNMSFQGGYIKGLNSISVKVGTFANLGYTSSSSGVITFGYLTYSYNYLVEYFGGGSESGTVALVAQSTKAEYFEEYGTKVSSATATISFDGVKFYSDRPERILMTTESQNRPDWKVTTYEEMIKNMCRQKINQLINDGLRSIYF